MTEKRYKVHNMIKGMNVGELVDLELMKELIEEYGTYEYVDVAITNNGKEMTYKEVVDLLNENEQLKDDIEFLDEKIKENEWHWNTIDEDRDVWKYKCNQLTMENEGLKKRIEYLEVQLYHNSDEGVCSICKNQYLEQGKTYDKYYISKCQKGHEECSTDTLKYCDDFELDKGDVE